MELSFYIIGIVAALIAYVLNNNYKMGIVLGSVLPSLVFALLILLFTAHLPAAFSTHAPVLFYGAAFIGMASKKILNSYFLIAVAGAEFTFVYQFTSPFFDGFGGALGTTAGICFLSVYAIKILSNAFEKGAGGKQSTNKI